MKRLTSKWLAAAALVVVAEAVIVADVLTLRDGRRIDGSLVGVRGDVIEFEHRGGRDDGRVRRYDRADVRSIQFEDFFAGDRFRDDRRDEAPARSGMRERSVAVDARTAWTDTGIVVRAGQALIFAATGEVRWGPSRRDGASGERNSPFNAARPMPERNAAALIGKIGEDGDPFFIGGGADAIRMRASGRLFLGINDDYLQDNAGSFRVVITY